MFDAFDVCWFAKMNLLCLCRQMPPDAARCRQECLGKLLHLEEAAEDWADAAAVPVELVLSLGQARFGIQAADF